VTYVCERPGQFVIPAARLSWFNLDAQKLEVIDFPVRTLSVEPNPAMVAAAAKAGLPANPRRSGRGLLIGLVAAIALNGIAVLAWKTRSFWRPLVDVLRPVHLASLNPDH
jgi:hypothetical protein